MSAKAKTKAESNHKIEIVDTTGGPAADGGPAPATEPVLTDASAATAPPSEAVAVKPPLAARLKVAGNHAVLVSFAKFRTAQATAVEKALAWVAVLDTVLTRSLTTGEAFLLARLGATPAPAPAPAAAE